MAPRGGSLLTVEAGRAIAALLVVAFHASDAILPTSAYWDGPVFGGFFDFGYAGVEFFFVISGFIIAHVHAGDIDEPGRFGRFARRRLLRIYPLYWLTLSGALLLGVVLARLGARAPAQEVGLASILLVGREPSPPGLAVAWTLFHEMLFYAVFGLWILSRRLGLSATAIWLLAILAGPERLSLLPPYVSSPLNLLFAMGVGSWWLARRGVPAPGAWIALGGLAFLALGLDAIGAQRIPDMPRNLGFGVASALMLTGLVCLERQRPVAVPATLVRLGAASYAIYLCHFPLLNLLHKLAGMMGLAGVLPASLAMPLIVGATVALGLACHLFVEQPLRLALDRLWRRRGSPA